ncbi:hypothetical protein ACFE04_007045 [Oxalis oulophora]
MIRWLWHDGYGVMLVAAVGEEARRSGDKTGREGTHSGYAAGREGTRSGEATGREGRRSGEATINPLRLWLRRCFKMSLVVRGRGESRKEWRGCEVVVVVKVLIDGDGGRKKV